MKLTAANLHGIYSHCETLKRIKTNEKTYELCLKKADEFYHSICDEGITVVSSLPPWKLVLEVMEKYHLLLNDALIASTCKYYGIKKIASFNEDFDRVKFLERIKI